MLCDTPSSIHSATCSACCYVVFFFICFCFFLLCFFFQAEDGIRDLVRSRGLGDVYKRQQLLVIEQATHLERQHILGDQATGSIRVQVGVRFGHPRHGWILARQVLG